MQEKKNLASAGVARLEPESEIRSLASDVFEDEVYAESWLDEPNTALGNKKPNDVLVEKNGLEIVRNMLLRIRYGTLA